MHAIKVVTHRQTGQIFVEVLFLFLLVVPAFLLGAQYLWRNAELAQVAVDAVRFAAWERTVWEPSDNETEKFALHKTNKQLGKDVVMRQLSTPAAWRNFRTGLSANGSPAEGTALERQAVLHDSMKSYVSAENKTDPNDMILVDTNSGWKYAEEQVLRGIDPTAGKLTSLSLDRNTWRTVYLTFKGQYQTTGVGSIIGNFVKDPVEIAKSLSLITNSWAASPPVSFVRDRQLMPLSTGDDMSGTPANPLGLGMNHAWAAIGGPSGFGGQYLVRQIGLNASQASDLVASSGESFQFDLIKPISSMGIMAQTQQPEYFNINSVSNWHHAHTLVHARLADNAAEPDTKAYNSNISKLKYRALSLQNPTENYFAR